MITRNRAIHVIQGDRFGNSNWQMGQIAAFSSISIAQEGHSLVFMCFMIDYYWPHGISHDLEVFLSFLPYVMLDFTG